MAINVDTVYQTVQDILNVEQRGYVPGTDFNSFSNLAQMDLFNKLFFDKAHFTISQKGSNGDILMMIQEKIDIFVVRDGVSVDKDNDRFALPADLYNLERVYFTPTGGDRVIVDQIDHVMSNYILNSPLTSPTTQFPKYERYSGAKGVGAIQVYPASIAAVTLEYVKTPTHPIWGARNIGGTAVYDSTISVDFDLHPSMFDELVDKITYYAALSIKDNDVAGAFKSEAQVDNQTDKS